MVVSGKFCGTMDIRFQFEYHAARRRRDNEKEEDNNLV